MYWGGAASCGKNEPVPAALRTHTKLHMLQAVCRNVIGNRIIHVSAGRLLSSYLFTSILSSPACCSPVPPSPFTSIHYLAEPGDVWFIKDREANEHLQRGSTVNRAKKWRKPKTKREAASVMESRSGVLSFPPFSHSHRLCFIFNFHIYRFYSSEFASELRINCVVCFVYISFTLSSSISKSK